MNNKKIIRYDIPIQGEEDCEGHNKKCRDMFGDNFTPFKSTDEHLDILFKKFQEGIQRVGDEGGWYLGDGIKVNIEIEYEPENK
ncbi:hypothetical protein IEN91_05065 [Bacillus velezensis]|nr:hypothetical protein IEN91_05065 [Bacillus velezensis]